MVTFLDDEILHCLLWVLSFMGWSQGPKYGAPCNSVRSEYKSIWSEYLFDLKRIDGFYMRNKQKRKRTVYSTRIFWSKYSPIMQFRVKKNSLWCEIKQNEILLSSYLSAQEKNDLIFASSRLVCITFMLYLNGKQKTYFFASKEKKFFFTFSVLRR